MATTAAAATIPAFLVLLVASISPSAAEIRSSKIRSDGRPTITLDLFGFTHTGHLDLNVSGIDIRSSDPNIVVESNLVLLGFLLANKLAWNDVMSQIYEGEIRCALDSDLVKKVYTFDALHNPMSSSFRSAFGTLVGETGPGYYALIFVNCLQNVEVSMDVRSSMYNLDTKTRKRDYLSVGSTILPQIYFFLFLAYAVLCLIWVSILLKKRPTAFRIHYFMLAVIVLKALNLLCEAEDKSYIKRTGSARGWDVLFYIFSFLKGIMLFTLLVLIGTGWSFLKPYLQGREKKVLMIVIPLQIVANIAQVIVDERVPYDPVWFSWKKVLLLVDIACCFSVILPLAWSIKNLREAARTDGKAAVNLMKLTLFRHYYVVIICYLYFTRVAVFVLSNIASYRYDWTSVVAGEFATLAFYIFTGYKFKPETHNPYFPIDDEEEEAAAEALKSNVGFEL